ncbi:hypothetical protein [Catellatospora tritici]|uniref:hypothetical protein n=1 Tax=Catellatospora tritici TaxID=2851566 RepID=UPI001C2D28EE|nr:hypothetical protein [Catellatospora tritici]MBV1850844.1 hypothetical protein [Catellatospora tritici]MBV1851097.1 hypothetical protein [Catellatospora tritici]
MQDPATQYAATVRPAVDRVYSSMRRASIPQVRALVERTGRNPGFAVSFYFGLLARPMDAAGFAAATTYNGGDMTTELEQGIAVRDADGAWHLTDTGRDLTLEFQRVLAESAQEHWAQTTLPTMPGLTALPRLAELLAVLLEAGQASGGPAFATLTPVYEPAEATDALRVCTRLGALRHHRADAHRAAWAAAGLTLDQLRALDPDSPQRQAIEDDTNRRDAPIYQALTSAQRLEFLGLLAALP